jgi:diguanylate cyclase (GGDEF)-like protein
VLRALLGLSALSCLQLRCFSPPRLRLSSEGPAQSHYAEVLSWQNRLRAFLATLALAASLGAWKLGLGDIDPSSVLVITLAYLSIVGGVDVVNQRDGGAPPWAVGMIFLADLAFVFAMTAATTIPPFYGRTLLAALFLMHTAETCFGRGYSVLVLGGGVVGYLAIIGSAIRGGADLPWSEVAWTTTIYAMVGAGLLAQYGSLHRRMHELVRLFERAEEGDFSQSYDVKRDRYVDAVSRVGRAYNRVRIQLASMVLTDPLTGCFNRRGFDQSMAREVARAARASSDLSLLALDIDHFKEINDTYGHLAGDVVLREFGALLVQTARAGDMVSRTGGEEFSLLLPDTAAAGAYQFATRLCDVIRQHVFLVNGKPITVTVSIGVATAEADRDATNDQNLKQCADEALYGAKRNGRDQVRVWSLDPLDPIRRAANLIA